MKFPFEFNIKLVFRLILPGLILSLALLPFFETVIEDLHLQVKVEAAFAFFVVFVGWLFVISDMHIYMLYEGRRYWPRRLKQWKVNLQRKRVDRLFSEAKEAYKTYNKMHSETAREPESLTNDGSGVEKEALRNYQLYLETSVQLREYNINEDSGLFEAVFPTRFGNILYAFENYPKRTYGMDPIFYWYRLWLLVDKDVREEIDNHQSIADSSVYCSFAFYLAAGVVAMYAGLHGFGIGSIRYIDHICFAPIFVVLIVLGFLTYLLSLSYQKSNGELFKSLFDIHRGRFDVDKIVRDVCKVLDDNTLLFENDRVRYDAVWMYLQNYRVRKGEKVVTVPEAKAENPHLKPD